MPNISWIKFIPWVLLGLATGPVAATDALPKVSEKLQAEVERDVIELTNLIRAEQGLAPLKLAPQLSRMARMQARDAARRGKLSHQDSQGRNPLDRARLVGYEPGYLAEILNRGPKTVEQAIVSWWNSPPHQEKLLNAESTHAGVALVADRRGRFFWAMVFGRPR